MFHILVPSVTQVPVGTLQMALLMPFNQCDIISFADLMAATTVRYSREGEIDRQTDRQIEQ